MNFNDLLKKWNGGISRGAQKRFAKRIGVNRVTVSRWANGELIPGEEIRVRLAKELGVTVPIFMASIPQREILPHPKHNPVEWEKAIRSMKGGGDQSLPGRLDQLTQQIADLQSAFGELGGELKFRMKTLEKENEKMRQEIREVRGEKKRETGAARS